MCKSGWFGERNRHRLARLGIKTTTKPTILPVRVDPYQVQDHNQERLIHSYDWEGMNFRYVLEGSGDVFRELTKDTPHDSYIEEKFRRIEEHIKEERTGKIHPDDGLERARREDKVRLDRLRKLWVKQPTNSRSQEIAKELNLNIIDGNWTEAMLNIELIRNRGGN